MNNPLQKFFRQPKIYISLPSKGLYYELGALQGDYSNMPILALTGIDEIILKTPDALFNGESTIRIIESCCPYIKDAKNMPSIDIDTILAAIKIATFGNTATVSKTCPKCGAENDYELLLNNIIDYFTNLKFNNKIVLNDQLSITIRPLKYSEMSYFSMENFKLQKILNQAAEMNDEDKKAKINEIYIRLSELQLELLTLTVETATVDSIVVTEKEYISDWLKNVERSVFSDIKKRIEENKDLWEIPETPVVCDECGSENKIQLSLDQSSFFG
jgi:hypothetical protein